jgi:ribonuclease Z
MDDVTITFLGTGAAIPPSNRFQSSIALKHPHGLVIFDVGEGAQYNLRKYQIPIRKEITIAISHMHADHYQGLGGLIASLNMLDRKESINLLVPKGGADLIKLLLHSLNVVPTYDLNFVEMSPHSIFIGNGYKIIAARALHFKNALAFKWMENNRPGKWNKEIVEKYDLPNNLKAKLAKGKSIEVQGNILKPEDIIGPERIGRIIVYSGDTKYNHDLIDFSKDVDVLIHEATYPADHQLESDEREHSTVLHGPKIGKLANVGIVLLTHIGTRVLDIKKESKLANEIYKSVIVKDGYQYVLEFKN